ncbi:30S ribosomal protein S17 [Candidatus Marsarchaeota archaeon]|nr:30S ribosomal protein S17 [Candidatus Marsarchaeota archaeon]MCL5404545.1 30S ribosomal protein S17 [Candidatus Marsarchaeota archaeon]
MECEDPKCPIHGNLKTHGSSLEGIVVSDKAAKTVIISRAYTTFLNKYERSLRRSSRIPAYNPACVGAALGDTVIIEGCRRLSKTKSYVVTKIVKKSGE